jgi:hypothetical protein
MTSIDFRGLLMAALPHAVAVVLMLLLASMVFPPVMYEGKELNQDDIRNNIGMAKETRDIQRLEGDKPHWTGSMFGGMPTIQIVGGDIFSAPKSVWRAVQKVIPNGVDTVFVAMCSAYVLGLCLGFSSWLSLLLAVGFGLSSVNVLYLAAGHATKVRAIATMPGVVGGVILAFRGKMWSGTAVAAFFAAIHIQSGHFQMTYYLIFLLVAIALGAGWKAFRENAWPPFFKTTGMLVLGAVIAALPQTSQLALTEQYSEFTTRGKSNLVVEGNDETRDGLGRGYILEYSMSRSEWLSIFIPDIKGGNNQLYWGEQTFSAGAFYFGALAFSLWLAWMIAGSSWLRWPTFLVSVLSVMLSWRSGSVVTNFFLDHVPLFDKFRDTKMMLVVLQVVIPMGAAMALHEMVQPDAKKQWKRWLIGGAIPALVLLAFYAVPESFFEFSSNIRKDVAFEQYGNRVLALRKEIFRADVLRSMGFCVFALLSIAALVKAWVKPQWVIITCALVLGLDLINVDGRYLGDRNYTDRLEKFFPFEATEIDQEILRRERVAIPDFDAQFEEAKKRWESQLDIRLTRRHQKVKDAAAFEVLNANSHYRVFNIRSPFGESRTSYFHKSVGGYHAAKLMRIQEFIDNILYDEQGKIIKSLKAGNFRINPAMAPGLAMLNAKYIVVPGMDQPLVYSGALGPAWFVDEVEWVQDAQAEISGVKTLDPARKALVHEEFKDVLGSISSPGNASVSLVHYHPEGSRYEVNSAKGGLLCLSEMFYPLGWTATIDGEKTPIVRANALLMALKVPSGKHEVQMSFEPEGWGMSKGMSYAGSMLWVALLGFCAWRHRRENA